MAEITWENKAARLLVPILVTVLAVVAPAAFVFGRNTGVEALTVEKHEKRIEALEDEGKKIVELLSRCDERLKSVLIEMQNLRGDMARIERERR